jgi:hydrophobic/amphiphilic exporter-1 (mainly G- bacteria), HAE1 family
VNLSRAFIERPVMTTLVMLTLLFFGLFAYRAMPVSDLPNVDFPTIEVSVSYPGANPETMANSVATPLEKNFMTIEGIQNIFSTSNTGSTNIVLQFALEKDINVAATDVESQISRSLPQLPGDLPNNPTYRKVNPSATPILYFAVTCPTMTMGRLYDYADTFIGERLSMVEGVSQISAFGSAYAVRVQINPEQLAAKQIGIDQVVDTLHQGNVFLPTGTLFGPREDFTIEVDGQITEAAGYNELILKKQDGTLVKIKEIGTAIDSLQDDKYYMYYITPKQEENSVILAVQRLPGGNSVAIIKRINKILEELAPQLPAGLNIHRIYDQSETILESVADLKLTLFVAFLLVVFIIYVSLGKLTNTIIPILALPLAVIGTFPVMLLSGFSMDILSMLAITLSIGFLVDDAIVVLENVVRHVQMGKSPTEASLIAAKEISITILSITLCLVAAFVPFIFMSGIIGRIFRECAVTIVIAVLLSGFLSLSLTPMLCSRWIRRYDIDRKSRIEQFSEQLNNRLLKIYEPFLRWALHHRITLLASGLFCVVASFGLFFLLPKDFLPPDDVGFIQGFTLARDGTSPFLMSEYHQRVNEILKNDPAVEHILSIASYTNPNEGMLFIHLRPYKDRPTMYQLIQKFSAQLRQIPGINVYLSPLPLINLSLGTTVQALYQYTLTSLDQAQLYAFAPSLARKMRSDPYFAQVSSDLRAQQPQLSLAIRRDRASDLNVSAQAIENVFNYAYSTNKVSTINGAINQYQVILETLPKFYRDPSVLSSLYVRSSTGALVPLLEVVEVQEKAGPLTVNHTNGLTSVTISFNTPPHISLGEALQQVKKLTQNHLPPGIYGKTQGTADIFASSFKSLLFLFPLAFFVIYVILGILYESFIHPLTVMSALPPTLLGGLLTLFVFRQPLSIYSFVGLIMLIGIVMKNGIMMIDFANERRSVEKKSAYDAIFEACQIRFRPILMTTVAAFMGALPIAIGIGGAMAQNHRGLGLAIVGGLIISQALTLLLTPVLYLIFEEMREKVSKKFSK